MVHERKKSWWCLLVIPLLVAWVGLARSSSATEAPGALPIASTVSQGGMTLALLDVGDAVLVPLLMTTAEAMAETEGVTDPDTVLSADIKDPCNPGEPVHVEVRRRIGETQPQLTKRFLDECDEVRKQLRERAGGTR